jgi:hypothetical protein
VGRDNVESTVKKARQREKVNTIDRIKDDSGRIYNEEEDIVEIITDLFKKLFTSSMPTRIDEVADFVKERLNHGHIHTPNVPFSWDEVKIAIFQMHQTKAPGLDGTPALFYQQFWKLVGDDVTDYVLSVLNERVHPGDNNETLISLIPKKKRLDHANDFRPISLCNVLFEIITKTIASRLKVILPDIICENQSVFVLGRLITDNALIAFECFNHMKKKEREKKVL